MKKQSLIAIAIGLAILAPSANVFASDPLGMQSMSSVNRACQQSGTCGVVCNLGDAGKILLAIKKNAGSGNLGKPGY